MTEAGGPCQLCAEAGGTLVWSDAFCRVVLAEEAEVPGTCRVVLRRHAAELSDLTPIERTELLLVVVAVEAALRELLLPDKINLASLGNLVPHLHWHVIPRWRDDRWFPRTIWAEPVREARPRELPHGFADALRSRLGAERA